MARVKKIGVLGGAFNPPHFGHLKIARVALKKLKLDKVIFIPAGIQPLKERRSEMASAKERLEMTKILIGKNPKFEISDYEIKKKGKSFTIETIKHLKRKYKKAQIYWIVGEDSLREIVEGKWKGKLKVLDLAKFVVFSRPSHKFVLKNLPKKYEKNKKIALKKVIFVDAKIPISATEIRERIKKGQKVEKFLPKKVLEYIKEKRLYV